MGDYYYYGCEGGINVKQAAEMYVNAARRGDPQVDILIILYKKWNLKFLLQIITNNSYDILDLV